MYWKRWRMAMRLWRECSMTWSEAWAKTGFLTRDLSDDIHLGI